MNPKPPQGQNWRHNKRSRLSHNRAAVQIQIGDIFRIHPGCDKRLDTCIARFANVLNFRGEPYVPGQDAMMSYPDAR